MKIKTFDLEKEFKKAYPWCSENTKENGIYRNFFNTGCVTALQYTHGLLTDPKIKAEFEKCLQKAKEEVRKRMAENLTGWKFEKPKLTAV